MARPEDHLTAGTVSPGWYDKEGLAKHFACSVSWVEKRTQEGMPCARIAGRLKFKLTEVEPWLEDHDYIERKGGGA